jgi:hypothetical protein
LSYADLKALADSWLTVINQAPEVYAGEDQTIVWDANVVQLNGTITDDGYPSGTLTKLWEKVTGPGTVYFGNDIELSTTAGFTLPGVYVLHLYANDGRLSSTDEVTITVQYPISNVAVFHDGEFKNSWRNLGDFRISQAPDEAAAMFAQGSGWGTIASIGSTNIGGNKHLEFDVYFDPNTAYPATSIGGFHMGVNNDDGWTYLWDTSSACWIDQVETTIGAATFIPKRWQHFKLSLDDNTAGGAFPTQPDIGVIRVHLSDPNGANLYLDNMAFTPN